MQSCWNMILGLVELNRNKRSFTEGRNNLLGIRALLRLDQNISSMLSLMACPLLRFGTFAHSSRYKFNTCQRDFCHVDCVTIEPNGVEVYLFFKSSAIERLSKCCTVTLTINSN